ncbi:hypothetical protein M0811_09918 [Anaeramoeba ignava]|uniref:Transmembrane protein n=1 Tax=Anaeramoeba ignava TaxID=1746090 RepID=A0A9Q0R9T5_ANAIG|nr:hypothetical protein M0811_09918 [Anaeramoeba ignava]
MDEDWGTISVAQNLFEFMRRDIISQKEKKKNEKKQKKEKPTENIQIEKDQDQDQDRDQDNQTNTQEIELENANSMMNLSTNAEPKTTLNFLANSKNLFSNKHLRNFFTSIFRWLKLFAVFHSCYLYFKQNKFWSIIKFLYRLLIILIIIFPIAVSIFALVVNIRKYIYDKDDVWIPGFWESSLNTTLSSVAAVALSLLPLTSWIFAYSFFRKPHFNELCNRFFKCPINGPRLARKVTAYIAFLIVYPILATLIAVTVNYVQSKMRDRIKKEPKIFIIDLIISLIYYWFQFAIVAFASILVLFLSQLHVLIIKAFNQIYTSGDWSISDLIDYHMDMQKDIDQTCSYLKNYIAVMTGLFGMALLLTIYSVFASPGLIGFRFVNICLYLILISFLLWFPAKVSGECEELSSTLMSTHISVGFNQERANELSLFFIYINNWTRSMGFVVYDVLITKSLVIKLIYTVLSIVLILVQNELVDFDL